MTDGRLLDAFGMVNERRKSVQKAKASSVPVDLRERSPSALSVDAFSTLPLGPFFRPFQAFGLVYVIGGKTRTWYKHVSYSLTQVLSVLTSPGVIQAA